MIPAGSIVGALYHSCNTQSNAPEDGRNHRPKHVELTGIINKPLLLHLVGCLYYLFQRKFVGEIKRTFMLNSSFPKVMPYVR